MRWIFWSLLLIAPLSGAEPLPPSPPPPQAPPLLEVAPKSYWKYHHGASVGYRRDRQKFQQPLSTQRYTDRNSLELILSSHLEWRHLVLLFEGNYGWLLNGQFHDTLKTGSFGYPLSFGPFRLGAGYSADVSVRLGMEFRCFEAPDLLIALIPFGGYKYSHMMNDPQGEQRSSISSSDFSTAQLIDPNQQDWFGPFVEARFRIIAWRQFEWDLFYQYHRPSMRSKSKESIDLYLFNPPTTLSSAELTTTNAVYRARSGTKQLAGCNFKYHGSTGWNFGAHFEGSSAWSDKARYLAKRTKEQSIQSPLVVTKTSFDQSATIHWVCYEVSLSLGYQF